MADVILPLFVVADRLRRWLEEDPVTLIIYSAILLALAYGWGVARGRGALSPTGAQRSRMAAARRSALGASEWEQACLHAALSLPGPFAFTDHEGSLEALADAGLIRRGPLGPAPGGGDVRTWTVPIEVRAAFRRHPLARARLRRAYERSGVDGSLASAVERYRAERDVR